MPDSSKEGKEFFLMHGEAPDLPRSGLVDRSDLTKVRSLFDQAEEQLKNKKEQIDLDLLDTIISELQALNRKLDLVFGTHVLVNGEWLLIKPLTGKKLNDLSRKLEETRAPRDIDPQKRTETSTCSTGQTTR